MRCRIRGNMRVGAPITLESRSGILSPFLLYLGPAAPFTSGDNRNLLDATSCDWIRENPPAEKQKTDIGGF